MNIMSVVRPCRQRLVLCSYTAFPATNLALATNKLPTCVADGGTDQGAMGASSATIEPDQSEVHSGLG